MNKRLGQLVLLPILFAISILPFWVLYVISDLFLLLIKGIKYRSKIIDKNLSLSFPNMSINERTQIKNQFYSHLCDIFVETLKTQTISKKEISKRLKVKNIELLNNLTQKDKNIILLSSHFGNWEWLPAMSMQINALGLQAYHPLKNEFMDWYILKLRSRFGAQNVRMKQTLFAITRLNRNNSYYVLALISDQSPSKVKIRHYVQFLNQTTPIITGGEKLAKINNDAVVFQKMKKIKRGYYEVEFILLEENSKHIPDYQITEKYTTHLESMILEQPPYWLWSHNRWKYASNEQTHPNEFN